MTAQSFDWGEMPKAPKNSSDDPDAALWGPSVQLGIRLTGRQDHMLSAVREWLAKKPIIDLDGKTGVGPEVAKTNTTLARFLIEGALENLYADLQIDQLIDHAALLWSQERHYEPDAEFPSDLTDEVVTSHMIYGTDKRHAGIDTEGVGTSYPKDLIEAVVHQGFLRWKEQGVASANQLVDGKRLLSRMERLQSKASEANATTDPFDLPF